MNYIYLNTIKNFVEEDTDDMLEKFKRNFKAEYGEFPEIQQIKAWESSITYLKRALNQENIKHLSLLFEYRLPFGNERIDLIVFGKDKEGKPTILLFELKGWKSAQEASPMIVNSDIGKSVHPEYQVENYAGKLRFSHSEAANFNIITAVLMYNGNHNSIKLNFRVPVFFNEDVQKLSSFISDCLPQNVGFNEISKFVEGKYFQTKKLFEAIKEHFDDIQKQSYLALAESGWGLSNEQLELIEEIIEDLKTGKRDLVYLVQGGPGSGKTLIAIHLLLASLSNGFQTILAYRNNRLINSIRTIFDSIHRGLSNPIKFYSVGVKRGFSGVAERNFKAPKFDLVIYDEAQRMTKENIYYAIQRGKITVFFYDETQILNSEEEGLTENFETEAKEQNMEIKQRFLQGFYRVEGGIQYHKFVESLLQNPEKIDAESKTSWRESYELKILSSMDDLLSALVNKREKGFKVALIAAFTESPGDFSHSDSIKNLRIGYPLYSGFDIYKDFNKKIYWLMDPKKDYVPFWVGGESNRLENCASIYGCQGFETDYAGLIWGRDFVFREGGWIIGDNCEDNVGRPSLKTLINKAKNGDSNAAMTAKRLLINRYRIFLTRGIKGTFIFCEDTETTDFLKSILED